VKKQVFYEAAVVAEKISAGLLSHFPHKMSENESEYGYVTENRDIPTTGHLVLYSVIGGRVSYTSFAEQAIALGLPRSFVPSIRKLMFAFATAKDNINQTSLPRLETAEGWDGVVDRKLKIVPLRKGHEYVVQIEMRGRMRGKNHVSTANMFRLEFSPPEDMDVAAWRDDYMNVVWNNAEGAEQASESEEEGKTAEQLIAELRQCISVTRYWEDTEFDPVLFARISQAVVEEFLVSAVSVDGKMLRDKVLSVISGELGGLPYRSGQGAWFIPKYDNDESYLETLENYSTLLEYFGNTNALTGINSESNWFGDDGKPRDWHKPRTNLRIMGYIDNERQMSYIRQDIQTNIGREIGEYQQKLMEVAGSFNDDKVEDFEKRLDSIQSMRTSLRTRLSNLTKLVGNVELDTNVYSDIQENLDSRVSRIRGVRSSVADRVLALSRIQD